MLKERINLVGITDEAWTEAHDDMMEDFLTCESTLLVAYMDTINGLTLETRVPFVTVDELIYFIRKQDNQIVTSENFLKLVQYGNVTTGHIQSLLRLMSGIYAPIFFENTSWPDSIKNDFSAQMHRFLASLTDTRWKIDGKTVLYIPTEGLSLETEVAAKNKELVQRLESEKILWICGLTRCAFS